MIKNSKVASAVNLEMSSMLTLVLSEGPFSFRGQPVEREVQGLFFFVFFFWETAKRDDDEIAH